MTAEIASGQADLLKDAARVSEMLLAMEVEVDAVTRTERARRLEGIQAEIGYSAVAAETEDLVDTRIRGKTAVITPESLEGVLPLTAASAETTHRSREAIADILTGEDERLLAIVGPCSIHDPEAALEYAKNVGKWRQEYGDSLEVVMRFYPEKPRTELGWKGFVYDPRLDESDDINLGIVATRMLAGRITDSGVPLAMERLNALTPQYYNGMVAYDAIGARNSTDQKAREYGSGTSSPVGFKNTIEGSIEAAAQAVVAANGPHTFLGMGLNGTPNQVSALGNDLAHIILRGAVTGPNYSAQHIERARQILTKKGLLPAIVVDVSHGNSGKVAKRQFEVVLDVSEQIAKGEVAIRGVMIESNLVYGNQELKTGGELFFGQSITDECSGLEVTEAMLGQLARSVQSRKARPAEHRTA